MPDPLWLPDVLRAEGLIVHEYPGWRDRGHGDFGDIWGVMCHHTGNNPPINNPGYIANHPQLGLCSQLHLARDGVYTVCGAGIAWHAGQGSWPGIAPGNANQVTIGIEAENNGTEGWSPPQYGAYVLGVAAILRFLGKSSAHVIGHKEWAVVQGKWDPGGIDMNVFRREVQQVISEGGDAEMSAAEVRQIQDFIAGFCGPIGSDVKDIREQLAGQGARDREAGYPGWPQLGGLTPVDALAKVMSSMREISARLDRLEGKPAMTVRTKTSSQ